MRAEGVRGAAGGAAVLIVRLGRALPRSGLAGVRGECAGSWWETAGSVSNQGMQGLVREEDGVEAAGALRWRSHGVYGRPL